MVTGLARVDAPWTNNNCSAQWYVHFGFLGIIGNKSASQIESTIGTPRLFIPFGISEKKVGIFLPRSQEAYKVKEK